jgi:hypothetical protein
MKKLTLFFASALTAFHLSSPSAFAQSSPQVGRLNCVMGPTVGLIIGSVQRMACTFNARNGARESYAATFKRLGLDIGVTAGGRLAWSVYARTAEAAKLKPRALAGTYIGASGDIAFGLGVGANALVGGSQRTIVLQPVSVEGQVGIGIALGAASFRLR